MNNFQQVAIFTQYAAAVHNVMLHYHDGYGYYFAQPITTVPTIK